MLTGPTNPATIEERAVKRAGWLALILVVLAGPRAQANLLPHPFQLDRLNRKLAGRVVDHTHNHGADRRIWSQALNEKRDLYIYLPPGFDPCKKYPLVIYLHGFFEAENGFLEDVVKPLDRAIVSGQLPPVILAAPDGSVHGINCLITAGTFFLNSKLGNFEDFLVNDVYDFVMQHYPIRPEPEAHALFGVSMGGRAAFACAIKYRDKFRVAAGIFPPLNLRWISCRGRYMDDFDPCCWGWRTDFNRGRDVIGRFYGVIVIRLRRTVYPLYGRNNPDTLKNVIAANPIELLDLYDVKPGDLQMYVAYAGKDEFNLDAQAESFLYRAREKGLEVGVGYEPKGRHNVRTGMKLLPGIIDWMRERLQPYSPH
jgi:pimeloyl-ACP methyl ester carboxylesterase